MISDTLHDAAAEIEQALKDSPEFYRQEAAELRELVARMRAIQTRLDKPPGLTEH